MSRSSIVSSSPLLRPGCSCGTCAACAGGGTRGIHPTDDPAAGDRGLGGLGADAARAEDATRTVRFEMLSSADAAERRLFLRGGDDELGASNASKSSLLEEYRGTMGVEEGDGELRVYIRGVAVVNADAVPGGFGARRLARRVARAALGNQVRRTLGDVAGVAVLEKKRGEAEKI